MAVAYNWSELNDTVAFNALEDTLYFDDVAISAAGLGIVVNDADPWVQFTSGGKTVTLTGVSLASLTTTNMTFADGSQLIVGDDTTGTGADEEANSLWVGNPADNRLIGLGGDDQLYGNGGNNVMEGGAGNDSLNGGDFGDDVLDGGAGNDYLWDTGGSDRLLGGEGDDQIYSWDGQNDTVDGGAGNDYLAGDAGDSLQGGEGDDTISLSDGAGIADGGAGNDHVSASNGSHTLTGGDGQDTFYFGGSGVQTITDFAAGAGGDRMDTTTLISRLTNYESGNPFGQGYFLLTQVGADTHLSIDPDGNGEAEWQHVATLQSVDASQIAAENFGLPVDPAGVEPVAGIQLHGSNISGTVGNDVLSGSGEIDGRYGDDLITGGQGSDMLRGDQGNDTLIGGDGDDDLVGGSGDDVLDGGDGDDRLAGGGSDPLRTGNDLLTGGAGRDSFELRYGAHTTVTDFSAGAAGDVVGIASLELADYAGGDPFASGHFRLVQRGEDTHVLVDQDGGAETFLTSAVLQGVTASSLTAENFDIGYAPLVNSAPQPAADAFATDEDIPITFSGADLLANDSDPDGDALQFGWIGDVVNGSVHEDAFGITFQPHADFNGTASFTYTVLDTTGTAGTATVNIDVAPANDVPAFFMVTAGASRPEDGNLLLNAPDPEGDPLSIVSVAGQAPGTAIAIDYGTLTVQADGSYTLDLDPARYATIGFDEREGQLLDIVAADPHASASGELQLYVYGENDAPVAQAFADISLATGEAFTLDATPAFSDVDASYGWRTWTAAYDTNGDQVYDDTQPAWLSFDGDSRIFSGTPDAAGAIGVQLTGKDDWSATAVNTFDIVVNAETLEGQAIDGYLSGATVFGDADNDGTLDTGEVSSTTDLYGNFTLLGAAGPLVAHGGTDMATGLAFNGVLRAPAGATVITPLTTVVAALVDQGQTLSAATANVSSAFGIDAGIDILSFDPIPGAVAGDAAAAQAYAAGIQVQNAIVQSSALLEGAGVANAGQAVVDQIATLAATGATVNLADAATVQALISAAAGATDVSAVAAEAAAVLAAANGEVLDALSAAIPIDVVTGLAQAAAVAQGSAVTSDLAQAGASGNAGTLVADYTGTNLQTLVSNAVVGDVNGSANTAPQAGDDSLSTNEDTPLTFTQADLLANDTDADAGDTKTFAGIESDISQGILETTDTGFVFTPNADFSGPASFVYRMNDAHGGTSTAAVTINVNPVNDAPVVAPAMVLDTSFAGDGVAATYVPGSSETFGNVMALQDDGAIIVAGITRVPQQDSSYTEMAAVVRYLPDGSLDTTFGSGGTAVVDISPGSEWVSDVEVAADGKIVIAGPVQHSVIGIARFNADGSLDTSFAEDGSLVLPVENGSEAASDMALQADGKILVIGTALGAMSVVRFNQDGTLDTTFADEGTLTTSPGRWTSGDSVAVQSDGRIVLAGVAIEGSSGQVAVARFNVDGTLDSTFGSDGWFLADLPGDGLYVTDIALLPDGDIAVSTATSSTFHGEGGRDLDTVVVKLTADGALDQTFGVGGMVMVDMTSDSYANSLAIGPEGSIYVMSQDHLAQLVRLTPDGTLNGAIVPIGELAAAGGEFVALKDLAIQADGSVVAAGWSGIAATRLVEAPGPALPGQTATEDAQFAYTLPAGHFIDPDGDPLTYTSTYDTNLDGTFGDAAWLSFDAATRTFSGTPDDPDVGAIDVRVIASDGSLQASDAFRVTVSNVNDAPVAVAGPLPDQTATPGSAFSYSLPSSVFLDVDSPVLSFSSSYDTNGDAVFGDAAPSWLGFDAATMTFSGTPGAANVGTVDVQVIASDGEFQASQDFAITVAPAPFVGGPGSDRFTGTEAGDLMQGNGGNDLLNGAGGNDLLYGGIGNDALLGGVGNDLLDGGTGGDVMAGGAGDDRYVVDQSRDRVVELSNAGTDTVASAITYTLGGNVENLELTGTANINGTGNSLNNTLLGNAAANRLDGGRGNDVVDGGGGNDSLIGGDGNDVITARNGTVNISAGSGADIVNLHNAGGTASLGSGSDIVYLNEWTSGTPALVVSDFNAGADTLDYSGLLASGQLVQIVQVGAGRRVDTHVQVDGTGSGTSYQTAVVLKNVQRSALNDGNLVGVAPVTMSLAAAQLGAVAALTMLEESPSAAAAPQDAMPLADLPAMAFGSSDAVASVAVLPPPAAAGQFQLPALGEAKAFVADPISFLPPNVLEKVAPVIERVVQHLESVQQVVVEAPAVVEVMNPAANEVPVTEQSENGSAEAAVAVESAAVKPENKPEPVAEAKIDASQEVIATSGLTAPAEGAEIPQAAPEAVDVAQVEPQPEPAHEPAEVVAAVEAQNDPFAIAA